jgi:D-xylose transport system ATP-binding protein
MASIKDNPILSLHGICKNYGSVEALRDVSLDVFQGEIVALVGDNGAGKTTLIKVIAGANTANEGYIEFKGKRVKINNPSAAGELGISVVYQDLAVCDNLSIVANLFLGRELSVSGVLDEVEMEKKTRSILDELAIELPDAHKLLSDLSGGQRQTVAVIRSLLGNPRVVILDEPTAALGVLQTEKVLKLIKKLKQRGHAVILISHNLANVFAVADRIVVLRLGRKVAEFQTRETSNEAVVGAITGAFLGNADLCPEGIGFDCSKS